MGWLLNNHGQTCAMVLFLNPAGLPDIMLGQVFSITCTSSCFFMEQLLALLLNLVCMPKLHTVFTCLVNSFLGFGMWQIIIYLYRLLALLTDTSCGAVHFLNQVCMSEIHTVLHSCLVNCCLWSSRCQKYLYTFLSCWQTQAVVLFLNSVPVSDMAHRFHECLVICFLWSTRCQVLSTCTLAHLSVDRQVFCGVSKSSMLARHNAGFLTCLVKSDDGFTHLLSV